MISTRRTRPAPAGHDDEDRARSDRALLVVHARDGDPAARDALVERFLPLAHAMARRFSGSSSEPLDDLQQVAVIGLLKAIDRFDPQREIAFSSFAVPTITGELKRYLRDRSWSVRPPRDLLERSLRVQSVASRLVDELKRQPTVGEIAARVGDLGDEGVLEALQASQSRGAASLQAHQGDDPEAPTLEERLGHDDDGFDRAEDRSVVETLLRSVNARERDVLRMRFAQDMTQAEIADVIGVSQMQVSRILRQAVERLREAAAARARAM